MLTMKWLRRNNKKILAFLVIFLAVMFLLPNFRGNSDGRSREDAVIGTVKDRAGKLLEITSTRVMMANQELQLLKAFRLDLVLNVMGRNSQGSGTMLSELLGLEPGPVMMLKLLLLPDNENRSATRSQLLQMAQSMGGDSAERAMLRDNINALMDVDGAAVGRYFVLLSMEAEQAGFAATPEQIETVFEIRRKFNMPETIEMLCRNHSSTEENLKFSVGRYLTILRYMQQVVGPMAISENQLRKMVRDQWELENIDGTYVSFSSQLFHSRVANPTEEQIQQHFMAHKQNDAGHTSEGNAFGFGYRLPDRVQLEFIRIDMQPLSKVLTTAFEVLSASDREQKLQKFWQDNKMLFREKLENPNAAAEESSKPQYRDPAFDEVAGRAQAMMVEQEARQKVEAQLNIARNCSMTALGATAGKQKAAGERTKKAVSYAELAQQLQQSLTADLGTDAVKVTYVKTGYLSAEDIQRQIGRAGQPRKNQGTEPLTKILFESEPFLADQPYHRYDTPPVGLYDDIVPVFSMGNNSFNAGYMIRMVATDAAREPVSLADDGSAGPADQVTADPNSSALYTRVVEDYKNLQAFTLVEQEAKRFAQKAAEGWDAALAAANEALRKDPNDIPLREERVVELRNQLERIEQMSRQSQSNQQMLQYYMAGIMEVLKETVDLANQPAPAGQQPMFNLHQRRECLVFKDLKATPPTEDEYLRRKPMIAQRLREFNQERLVLTQLNPKNIDQRMAYVSKEPEKDATRDAE